MSETTAQKQTVDENEGKEENENNLLTIKLSLTNEYESKQLNNDKKEVNKKPTQNNEEDLLFANRVAELTIEKYNYLMNHGKKGVKKTNNNREWTILSSLVMTLPSSLPYSSKPSKYNRSNNNKFNNNIKFNNNKNNLIPNNNNNNNNNNNINNNNKRIEVISVTAGNKCLSPKSMDKEGTAINDSHAEILTKRAFHHFLISEMKLLSRSRIFDLIKLDNNMIKFQLKKGIEFHLYTSQSPCGDASIFPLSSDRKLFVYLRKCNIDNNIDNNNNDVNNNAVKNDSNNNVDENRGDIDQKEDNFNDLLTKRNFEGDQKIDSPSKRLKLEDNNNYVNNDSKNNNNNIINDSSDNNNNNNNNNINDIDNKKENKEEERDINRTGAKTIGEIVDSHLPGENYHQLSVLRTKPGKGERTLSLSCSDKIARWNVTGIQGSLCSLLLHSPIFLSSIIVGDQCHIESLHRALNLRLFEKKNDHSRSLFFSFYFYYCIKYYAIYNFILFLFFKN